MYIHDATRLLTLLTLLNLLTILTLLTLSPYMNLLNLQHTHTHTHTHTPKLPGNEGGWVGGRAVGEEKEGGKEEGREHLKINVSILYDRSCLLRDSSCINL
jgi:hypothetical protein